MPRRADPEGLSPRALARLRAPRAGYVPTRHELSRGTARVESGGSEGTGGSGDTGGAVGAGSATTSTGSGSGVGPRPPRGVHRHRVRPRGWVRLPAALTGARWQPGRAAVLGVVVVTLLAVAVFGLRVAWAQRGSAGTVIAPGGGSRAGPTGISAGAVPVGVPPGVVADGASPAGPPVSPGDVPAGASGPGPAPPGSAAVVVVHVVGEVRTPGVQELPAGSRVSDALDAAGGPTREADLARVNLARLALDGEQIRVPAPGDPDPVGAAGGPPGPGAGSGAGAAGRALVPLNSADLAALDTLPGVGPVLAQRILDWRAEHGRFTSVDELGEVSGIGEKVLAELRPLVTL